MIKEADIHLIALESKVNDISLVTHDKGILDTHIQALKASSLSENELPRGNFLKQPQEINIDWPADVKWKDDAMYICPE